MFLNMIHVSSWVTRKARGTISLVCFVFDSTSQRMHKRASLLWLFSVPSKCNFFTETKALKALQPCLQVALRWWRTEVSLPAGTLRRGTSVYLSGLQAHQSGAGERESVRSNEGPLITQRQEHCWVGSGIVSVLRKVWLLLHKYAVLTNYNCKYKLHI